MITRMVRFPVPSSGTLGEGSHKGFSFIARKTLTPTLSRSTGRGSKRGHCEAREADNGTAPVIPQARAREEKSPDHKRLAAFRVYLNCLDNHSGFPLIHIGRRGEYLLLPDYEGST